MRFMNVIITAKVPIDLGKYPNCSTYEQAVRYEEAAYLAGEGLQGQAQNVDDILELSIEDTVTFTLLPESES